MDSMFSPKLSARLKRATLSPLKYTATPPAYFIRTFSTAYTLMYDPEDQ